MIKVFCDGGSRSNPGPAAYGFVVYDDQKIIHKGKGYIGIATNNFAEYTAVIQALLWLSEKFKKHNLNFYLDSNLVVSQLRGIFKIKSASLRELIFKIKSLETTFGKISYWHIPRSKNKEADELVNQALDEELYKKV